MSAGGGRIVGPTPARRRAGLALVHRYSIAVMVVTVVAVLTAFPVDAAGARAGQQAGPTLELVEQPSWVRPGEPFIVQLQVSGAPAGATLGMVVHDRLQSRQELRASLGGELGGEEYEVDPQPVASGQGSATVGFTPGSPGASLSGQGVYPVEIVLRAADGSTLASLVTFLSFLDETPEFPPLDVAVLVDVAAPAILRPTGAYEPTDETLDRVRDRVQLLEDTAGLPLTVAPRPETIEGLANARVPGPTLVERLRRLAAGAPVLARPFVDVDLAALRRADLLSEAAAQADGGANVVRTQLGVEPTGGIWMSGPNFGADAARTAVDLRVDRAIVPPSTVADLGDVDEVGSAAVPLAPVRYGDGGPLTMVTDDALAAHLTSTDGVISAHRFLAELTITWLESPSVRRGVVVHVPAEADIQPTVVATALGALADGQAVRLVPVDQVFADDLAPDDGTDTVAPAPAPDSSDLGGVAPAVRNARQTITGVGALLDDPTTARQLSHSLLLSTGVDTPDADRAAYVGRTRDALSAVSGAVTLPDAFRITLTSRSSTIPVTLTNNTEQNLKVRVELDSAQLEFPEGDVLTPVLPPGTTRIEVDVRARTSGAFTLEVAVTSPDGSLVLDTSTFDVRSTAISGVGLVLSVGAGLFLAIWWARHWRSSRRSRRLGPAGPDDFGTTPAAGPWGGAAAAHGTPAAPGPDPPRGVERPPAHMSRRR